MTMPNETFDWSRPPGERDMSGLLLSEAQPSFPGHLGGIRLLKFTSDCRRFLFADLDMNLTLATEAGPVARFDLGSDGVKTKAMDRIHDVALSPDGRFAFVAAGLHLRCLDLDRGWEMWRYRPENMYAFLQTSPRAVGVTKNLEVFVCNDNGSMNLFRFDGLRVARWRANDTPNMVSALADGDLFVGSDGYGITVWDTQDRRRVFRMKSSVHVFGLKAFPRGQLVAVRSEVGVSVIDLNNGEVRRTWPVAPGLPYIDVSPDGSQILVGSGRGVAVYDTDGSLVREEGTDGERVITAVFHPKSGHTVAGTETGQVVHLGSKVS